MKRPTAALAGLSVTISARQTFAAATPVEMLKTKGGFSPTDENVSGGALVRLKLDSGMPRRMCSHCTTTISSSTVEAQVPAAAARRSIAEQPEAVGSAVPEMPLGFPRQDFGDERDPYDIFLIKSDGSSEVFSPYAEN